MWIKYISSKEEERYKELSIFDEATYASTKNKFRFPYGRKSEKGNYPILSHPYRIKEYILSNVKEDAYEYSFKNTISDEVEINNSNNKIENMKRKVIYNNNRKININDELEYDNYEMCQEEKQLISEILRLLDDKYACEFKYWWRILAALKLYSNTKEMFEIFKEFSERCSEKFNYESCQWSWKNTNVNGITIRKLYNYLLETIEIYKSDGCNNEKIEEITKKLSKFHILTKKDVSNKKIEELEGIEFIENLEHIKFNNTHINENNIDIDVNKIFQDKKSVFAIKSRCGSGKTVFLKEVMEYVKKNNMDNEEYCINTLVLTSRVSLANTLSKTLDLSLYTNNKKHCLDSVYSIESCDKVINEINFYDENGWTV